MKCAPAIVLGLLVGFVAAPARGDDVQTIKGRWMGLTLATSAPPGDAAAASAQAGITAAG